MTLRSDALKLFQVVVGSFRREIGPNLDVATAQAASQAHKSVTDITKKSALNGEFERDCWIEGIHFFREYAVIRRNSQGRSWSVC